MGARLTKYFDYAKEKGGMQAQMRLAMTFGMPSNKAAEAPDSPESLAKIQDAVKKVLGESNIPNF